MQLQPRHQSRSQRQHTQEDTDTPQETAEKKRGVLLKMDIMLKEIITTGGWFMIHGLSETTPLMRFVCFVAADNCLYWSPTVIDPAVRQPSTNCMCLSDVTEISRDPFNADIDASCCLSLLQKNGSRLDLQAANLVERNLWFKGLSYVFFDVRAGISLHDPDSGASQALRGTLLSGARFLVHTKGEQQPMEASFLCTVYGRLFWDFDRTLVDCRKKDLAERSMHLSSIVKIVRGKRSKTFRDRACAYLPDDCCFSIVSTMRILNLQATTKKSRDLWVTALEAGALASLAGVKNFLDSSATTLSLQQRQEAQVNSFCGVQSIQQRQEQNDHGASDIQDAFDQALIGTLASGGWFRDMAMEIIYVAVSDCGHIIWSDQAIINPRERRGWRGSIALQDVMDVVAGKHTTVFQQSEAADLNEKCCLSVISRQTILNLVAKSDVVCRTWLSALKLVIARAKRCSAVDAPFHLLHTRGSYIDPPSSKPDRKVIPSTYEAILFTSFRPPKVIRVGVRDCHFFWAVSRRDKYRMHVSEINKVRSGKHSDVFKTRSTAALSPDACCFSIFPANNTASATPLDFQMNSKEDRDTLVADILSAMQHAKEKQIEDLGE